MKFFATHQILLALSMRTRCTRENRSSRFGLRARQGFLALFFAMVPVVASAQVGREFVSLEAHVGRSRIVHLGKIVELKRIEYGKPLTFIQKLGKPHRLVFGVSETIRGEEVKRLELVLSLQSTHFLEYMRDQSIEVMLMGGPTVRDSYSDTEIGIEEEGKQLDDDERYQFRLLDHVKVPEPDGEDWIPAQINLDYDSCRMFTNELQIIVGREAILKRTRAFARLYPDTLSTVLLDVPNEFGALCADPNAFCNITLPICPETKTTLVALKNDPGLILRRIKSENDHINLAAVLVGAHKALAKFPDGNTNPAAGQSKPTSQAADSPAEWVNSDDGDLSLRLRLKSAHLASADSIFVIAEIRNNRAAPVTILRPFGSRQLVAFASEVKVWGEHRQINYMGPIADFHGLNKSSFITLKPKEISTDTLELSVRDFAETGHAGSYAVRYDYSYQGLSKEEVAKEGVKGIWHGTICSRELQLKKQTARAPRLSREDLYADLRRLALLAEVLDVKPDDPAARQDAAAVAKRLAPHVQGDRMVWEILIKTRTLKDGMSLAEAEELIGPPARKDDKSAGWKYNPKGWYVAPSLHAKVVKDGLAEWKITNE